MIQIGFHNAAELLFQNQLIKNEFPKFKHFFDSWAMSQKVSHLKSLGIRSVVDFLNSVTKEDVEKISSIFKMEVSIMKTDLSAYRNIKGNIENFEFQLPLFNNVMDFHVYRKGQEVSVLINTGNQNA